MTTPASWTSLPRIGFDTETTGRNPKEARLVTCSIVYRSNTGTLEKRYWLADPGVEIPLETTRVHGITTEQARSEGRPIDEVLEEVAAVLAGHMKRGFPVVAYNAGYDCTLIECELARHQLPTLTERLGGEVFPVIDPYLLDRWLDQYRKGKRRLTDLVEHYGCESSEHFHNAEEDVLATLRVLDAMIESSELAGKVEEKFPGQGLSLTTLSLRQLHDGARQAHASLASYFNQKAIREGRKTNESSQWPIYR